MVRMQGGCCAYGGQAGGRVHACGEGTHAHRVHFAFQGGLGWRWRQGGGKGGGGEAEGEEDGDNGEGGEAQRVVNGGGVGGGKVVAKAMVAKALSLPGGSISTCAREEVAAARRAVWVAAMWR